MENAIHKKSMDFALKIISVYKDLTIDSKEFVMSKQLLKSGTSVGANIREAEFAQSRKDFASKMHIALKEAAETEYWLELLKKAGYIEEKECLELTNNCEEIKKILSAIIKTARKNC